MQNDAIPELARRLWHAGGGAPPVDPEVAGWLDDLELAHAVVDATRELAVGAGERVIGYKIGLTSQPARDAFGAVEPAAGHLLAGRLLPAGRSLSTAGLFAPKVEVEIAFVLGEPLPGPEVTASDVRNATAEVAPAFEIVDSRWRGAAPTLPMLVADNTNAARAVLGPRVALPGGSLAEAVATLSIGDREIPGSAKAVMGDPVEAVAWLARHLLNRGIRLEAGDIVLSGTLCPPTAIGTGDRLVADLGELGRVALDVD
ncbi:2-keto-4-pentenoate hydratase [Saccharopolyspora antimicrobica]|uniref:2-keto-4-pentenoate hydratase n=1 Tax=Saccharopolyspora antimicrobica TaxID=455193 RepID=A0A1I5C1C2_9PSEU|nr:fumarylacetoacetate hydrolase family protein [Saccharopolyspora antimicrobica]RKT89004.1 2-keto-4-pentenoate hydratase [Saccharopolyspora antimicrobica]SFN80833.1 2-keto-4-pentenoate hydratase [Saccharopolyspora antimicrobica]